MQNSPQQQEILKSIYNDLIGMYTPSDEAYYYQQILYEEWVMSSSKHPVVDKDGKKGFVFGDATHKNVAIEGFSGNLGLSYLRDFHVVCNKVWDCGTKLDFTPLDKLPYLKRISELPMPYKVWASELIPESALCGWDGFNVEIDLDARGRYEQQTFKENEIWRYHQKYERGHEFFPELIKSRWESILYRFNKFAG